MHDAPNSQRPFIFQLVSTGRKLRLQKWLRSYEHIIVRECPTVNSDFSEDSHVTMSTKKGKGNRTQSVS